MTCWGVVDTWRYEKNGRDLKITVEGVLVTDPFGKPIVRENKLTTGGRAWRGEILYSDGTSERADFMFLSDNEVDWKSNGDDNHVNDWYGNKPIRGKCVMIGDKVSISLKAKTIDDIEKKAEFKAEFEGVLRNGFLIEGTFKKDRAKILLIKTPFSNGIPDSDIKNLKIEKDTKGTFRIINSSGD